MGMTPGLCRESQQPGKASGTQGMFHRISEKQGSLCPS